MPGRAALRLRPTQFVVSMASSKKWDDLDISNDEAKRLCEAFKNEEFKKMFMEYAEELQDPENKKRYEEELAQMEAERGMDVKFIHPEPGYVVKTSVNGSMKAFINICKNEHVGKPEMQKAIHPQTGKLTPSWSVPHSLAPARDDIDNKGGKCKVYDVVFHPDAYRMGETNARFRKILNDSAIETIERQYGDKLDKNNLKFPKMNFKGTPAATILRSRKDGADNTPDKKPEDFLGKIPYPYDNKTSEEKAKENEEISKQKAAKNGDAKPKDPEFEVPKYSIVHRQNIDFQDFRDAPDARQSTRPKEIVIHIELPMLKSASSANLDIFEKRIILESTTPAKYKLDLNLPYPVDENSGSAKFDKSKRRLTVTLPVMEADLNELSATQNGDEKVTLNGNAETVEHRIGAQGDMPEDDVPGLEDVPELEDDAPTPENNVPDSKPLIQVLSSTENKPAPNQPLTNGHLVNGHTDGHAPNKEDTKDIWTEEDFDPRLLIPKISYKLPTYTANQDCETATFILAVKNVQRDSVSKSFEGENSVQLKFVSVGSGGFPMHYSFVVKFDADCKFDVTACDVSMSYENVVLILGKSSEAAGIWDKFLVGIDHEHLEEALFVTEKTLSSALDQLDANTMPLNNNDKMPDLEVTGMSDDQLTIQLSNTAAPEKPQRTKKYSESSDDIEVVHSADLPNLHGILKGRNRSASESSDVLKGRNRTVSESSDEVFGARGAYRREDSVSSILSTGSASEGPVSESEDVAHRKKSVSFSEYVDSTTYKSNASVSTLHATLKKKSKRYRKKEAKMERRRRRSSGSEHEHSSEEQSSQPETSESVGDVDDDDSDIVIDHHQGAGEELPEGPKADPHDEDEDSLNVVAAKQSKKSKKNKKKGKGKKTGLSEASAASHTPPETKGDSVTSEEGESGVEVVTPQDGERTKGVNGEKVSGEKVNGEKVNGEKVNGEKVNGEKVNGAGGTESVAAAAHGDDCDSDDTEHGPSASGAERTKKHTDTPDTVLSWDNGKPSGESEDVTKCAFNFNNSMMYDLDDD